jgi:hypothetical protein
MTELPKWDDISEDDQRLLETFYDSFSLKDGTRLTSENFGQGGMLGLEMFMLSRVAIMKAMKK